MRTVKVNFEGVIETIAINEKNYIFHASDKVWCGIGKAWTFKNGYSLLLLPILN